MGHYLSNVSLFSSVPRLFLKDTKDFTSLEKFSASTRAERRRLSSSSSPDFDDLL
jgi:hypothetical protein